MAALHVLAEEVLLAEEEGSRPAATGAGGAWIAPARPLVWPDRRHHRSGEVETLASMLAARLGSTG